jgi:hypothetical protein
MMQPEAGATMADVPNADRPDADRPDADRPDNDATGRIGVAVIGRNEAGVLGGCLDALGASVLSRPIDVTVLLNGCTDASAEVAVAGFRRNRLAGRVMTIDQPDKANAINQYLHALRPAAGLHVFVDAYAAVAPDAIAWLAAALRRHPAANAAAAVPTSGRSAAAFRAMQREQSTIHGSLFALRDTFVARLVALGLRLPVGLYRGDGLLGSFLLHDLDAAHGAWDRQRIVVTPEATWTVGPALRRDIGRHARRLVRQGRGRLENEAIKRLIYPGGFAALPESADSMIRDDLARHPQAAPRWWRDPAAWLALRQIVGAAPIDPARLVPRLVAAFEAPGAGGLTRRSTS